MAEQTDNKIVNVGKESELKEGEVKEVEVEEGSKVLVIKEKGKIRAIGNKCTHFAAPLKSGFYMNGRIRCPWHGACFSVETGDIEDFPGMDGIHTYPVEVKDGDVLVTVSMEKLKNWKRSPKCISREEGNKQTYLVIGGGPAAATAVETLRSEGFTGRIVLVCKEKYPPYDRTKLSKQMASNIEHIVLRTEKYYQEIGVDIMLGEEVTELDAQSKVAVLKSGTKINYEKALVAVGGVPRTLPVSGMDSKNIFFLRDPADAHSINSSYEGKRVVVVGSSFIGMEVAASIVKKAKSVVVVGMEKVPFERVLGEQIGTALQKLHEKNGVVFRMKRIVKEFRTVDGIAMSVLLDNGEVLDSDLIVVGAGIIPNTKFIKGVKIEKDQSVVCDKYLQAADGLYAAGDICRFPWSFLHDEYIRIEHWGMAHYQGKVAALNMVGKATPCNSVPFFWTVAYGKSIRYCGHALSYDEIFFEGKVEDLSFVGYYIKANRVIACVSIGKDPLVAAAAELMHTGKMPTGDEIKSGKIDLLKIQ